MLLADPEEGMIARYLEDGEVFVLTEEGELLVDMVMLEKQL